MDCAYTKKPEVIQGDCGYVLFCNFWENGTDTMVDVWLAYCNAPTYDNITSEKYLAKHEQFKKKNT